MKKSDYKIDNYYKDPDDSMIIYIRNIDKDIYDIEIYCNGDKWRSNTDFYDVSQYTVHLKAYSSPLYKAINGDNNEM